MTRTAITLAALVGLSVLAACGAPSYDVPQARSVHNPNDVWAVGSYR